MIGQSHLTRLCMIGEISRISVGYQSELTWLRVIGEISRRSVGDQSELTWLRMIGLPSGATKLASNRM